MAFIKKSPDCRPLFSFWYTQRSFLGFWSCYATIYPSDPNVPAVDYHNQLLSDSEPYYTNQNIQQSTSKNNQRQVTVLDISKNIPQNRRLISTNDFLSGICGVEKSPSHDITL